MRKILVALSALFMLSQVFVSCSSDQEILSQFSKRKYLKKYKSKDSKNENSINKRSNTYAYDLQQTENVVANLNDNLNLLETVETTKVPVEESFSEEITDDLKKVAYYPEDYSTSNKYDRNFSYFEMNTQITELENINTSVSSGQASDIVLVLLSIFLPPVAVVVYEDSVTGNFWLDLVLTLLFWIPGMVYAFLVCFADVSI